MCKLIFLFDDAVKEQYKQQVSANADVAKGQKLGGKKEVEVERDGKVFTLTLSDEIKYLKAMTDEEIAQMDLRSVKPDESDIFSYRPQDQWLFFSQYLNDNGIFDGKNAKEIEEIYFSTILKIRFCIIYLTKDQY